MATEQNQARYEQRLIDHEVRLTRSREAVERYVGGRQSREEQRSRAAEDRWFRDELTAMLAGAATREDLAGLGLSDQVIVEAGLGTSLADAWARHRPQPRR